MPIRVECPSCGKGVKAPSKYAGKVAKCPGCGGQISIPCIAPPAPPKPPAVPLPRAVVPPAVALTTEVLPAAVPCPFCAEPILPQAKKCKHCGEFMNEEDRPRQSTPPPAAPAPSTVVMVEAPARSTSTPEQELIKVRPAVFRNSPGGYSLLWSILVIGFGATRENPDAWVWAIPLFALFFIIIQHLKALTTTLSITTTRSKLRNGLLSKRTREVRHSDVRLLQVDQTIGQRLMGVGALSVASAAHGGVEIKVSGIKDPEHIKETIDGFRA